MNRDHITTAKQLAREEHIAAARDAAYRNAQPPHTAQQKAEQAGKAAALAWDREHS